MPRERLYLFDTMLRDGARGQRNTVSVAGEWLANT